MAYQFNELFEKLQREHTSNYYYRGQNQLFPGPLWPSMYRGVALINTMELPNKLHRRCNRGTRFGFRSNYLVGAKFDNPENIKLRELKRCMMGYVRNALGYCLSEAMFQQAGWDSEGLDVTSDIAIAMFFATYRYYNKTYIPDNEYDKEHIIYRWNIPNEKWDFNKLNASGYYHCPILLPSEQILNLFEECETIEEFEQSIHQYRKAIGWKPGFEYTDIQGKRPYQIIKIPKQWKAKSRIVQQSASLLFPDSISYDEFKRYYSFKDKECQKITENGGTFVEDLSTTCNCEIFKFKMTPKDFESFHINEDKIYITEDISHKFLNGWMRSYHQNPYGIPTIMIGYDDNYLAQIDMNLNFDPLRYGDNEPKFNG